MNIKIKPTINQGDSTNRLRYKWKKIIILASIIGTLLVIIAIIVPLVVIYQSNYFVIDEGKIPNCSNKLNNYNYKSAFGIFKNAAIAVDSPFCANVGKEILLKGGSSVDAAIAVSICNGISNPQSMGIGGGMMMMIYLKNKKEFIGIDSREVAPINAYEKMFANSSKASTKGGLATAVPGEIAGYYVAHQIAGKLSWKELFEPTIALCRNGTQVSEMLAWGINEYEESIRKDPGLSEVLIDSLTNKTLKENDFVRYPKLADTLEKIANGGAKAFYDGELSKIIVEENNLKGGMLTLEDLRNYKPVIRTPIRVKLNDKYTFHGLPPPSSGLLVSFILRLMNNFNFTKKSFNATEERILLNHRLIEAFKHAFAKRSYLGDSSFINLTLITQNLTSSEYIEQIFKLIDDKKTYQQSYYNPVWSAKEDHGTAHLSVIAENGDTVALTSSINTFFGAKYAGETTGIIYNNQMDDFSTPGTANYFGVPASPTNYIKPGKRPMSSMSPTIIVNENDDVRLAIGASGGTHIITSVAATAVKTLFLEESLKDAIDEPRLHHQLFPKHISFESDFPEDLFPQSELIKGLLAKKHEIKCSDIGNSIVIGIERQKNGNLLACSDQRKGGDVAGY